MATVSGKIYQVKDGTTNLFPRTVIEAVYGLDKTIADVETWVGNSFVKYSHGIYNPTSAVDLNSQHVAENTIQQISWDFNTYSNVTNRPTTGGSAASVLVLPNSWGGLQFYTDYNSNTYYIRNRYSTTGWKSWVQLYHTGNFNPANYLPLTGGTLNSDTSAALGIDSAYKIGTGLRTLHIVVPSGAGAGLNDGYADGITFGIASQAYAGIYVQSSGAYGTRMIFGTTGYYANGAYGRVIITHSGYVGIGTMTPSSLLHVNGTANITTAIVSGGVEIGHGNEINGVSSGAYTQGLHLNYRSTGFMSLCNGGGNVGIGTASPAYKLDVRGVIRSTVGIFSDGYVSALGTASSSDAKLKDDITTISYDRAKEVLFALNPSEWTWNALTSKEGERGAGMVAQEVIPILPDTVKEIGGNLTLEYNPLFAYGLAMTKYMLPMVETHEEKIARLEKEVEELKRQLTN